MYFSQRESLGKINMPGTGQRRIKRAIAPDSDDQSPVVVQRQKFNEHLRNQHIHQMLNTSAKLRISRDNAAYYGLHVDEMEDLLKDLGEVDDRMDV